jgi:hypothetical protein
VSPQEHAVLRAAVIWHAVKVIDGRKLPAGDQRLQRAVKAMLAAHPRKQYRKRKAAR